MIRSSRSRATLQNWNNCLAAKNQPLPGAAQRTQLMANSLYLPLHKICLTRYLLIQFNQYKFRLESYALIIPFQFD